MKSFFPFVVMAVLVTAISIPVAQNVKAQVEPTEVRSANRYSTYKSLSVTTSEQFVVLGLPSGSMLRKSYPDKIDLQCTAAVIVRGFRDGTVTGTPETAIVQYGVAPSSVVYMPATTYTGATQFTRFRVLADTYLPFSMRIIAFPTGVAPTRNIGFGLATASGTSTCDCTIYWGETS